MEISMQRSRRELSAEGRPAGFATIAALALPFTLTSGIQALLNATDTWFVGHISPAATSALSALAWPVVMLVMLFGAVSLAVQTLSAQAYGARRYIRASYFTWTAVWASLLTFPVFIAFAMTGGSLFAHLGLTNDIQHLMVDYWIPRMWGAPVAVMLMSLLGFFNGIERVTTTFWITFFVAVVNAISNQVLVVHCNWGIAGSAWATNIAQFSGLATALTAFLAPNTRAIYKSHRTVRPRLRPIYQQWKLGLPISLQYVGEFIGFALFQFIEVRLGAVDGAATQIVIALTSFCYLPASGIALVGITLVGKLIGAKRFDLAYEAGNRVILITVTYMCFVGVLLALSGTPIITQFTNPLDPRSPAVIELAQKVLWIAAAYQFFDGLNIASAGCLCGAADVRVPAVIALTASFLFFIPLVHSLAFAPGEGWLHGLPEFGLRTLGAWIGAFFYMAVLGVLMYARWRLRAWRPLQPATSADQVVT
jgi:MATE family multidrug resistance protein